MRFQRLLLFALSLTECGAQFFGFPAEWQHTRSNITLTRQEQEVLASSVAGTMGPLFDAFGQTNFLIAPDQTARMLSAIARTDYLSGNNTFQDVVLTSIRAVLQATPNISTVSVDLCSTYKYTGMLLVPQQSDQPDNSHPISWGLTAIDAYLAYHDSAMLDIAIAMWNQTSVFQLSESEALSGFSRAQNTTVAASCDRRTTAGAVFSYPVSLPLPAGADQQHTDVDSETVSAFIALSAHLFEITGSGRYLSAANAAADFVIGHMYDGKVIVDTIRLFDPSPASADCSILNIPVYSYSTGFAIWGLSVLATHNASYTGPLNQIISTAVPFGAWTNSSDGVVNEGATTPDQVRFNGVTQTLKVVWIRGLFEAWSRMDPNSDAAKFVQSYLYVQHNALLTRATVSGTNVYSPRWEGPPALELIEWGQLNALDLLNAGFAMAAKDNSSKSTYGTSANTSTTTAPPTDRTGNTSSLDPSPYPSRPPSHSKTRIVAGAVVGSFAFLALTGTLIVLLRRKHRWDAPRPFPTKPEVSHGAQMTTESGLGITPWTSERTHHVPVAQTGTEHYSAEAESSFSTVFDIVARPNLSGAPIRAQGRELGNTRALPPQDVQRKLTKLDEVDPQAMARWRLARYLGPSPRSKDVTPPLYQA